ncbi:iron uptake porin [Synechococcus sp. NB0720_010]|uniref:iron uptake porin n=1 Tax=Synechococcus sp. NB0720_010 TaxID=2907159 RepID=UPI001FFB07D4|nr:iron uptake porin [Synechococcus sp. NB0720_010]UPH91085.1 iron uptake porin [Synechococcus sp. NB0720_010]
MTMITRLSPLLLAGLLGLSQPSPAAEQERVNTLSQFSDLQPSDWAYQALSNLIEHYGCVAGYPNGNFSGTQALSRYEAAALLNTCLDRITEVTDQLKRLTKDFERELAVLRGRVDALDAKVGVLEASQFSTTTKLSGLAVFVVGGNQFYGNAQSRNVSRCPETLDVEKQNDDPQFLQYGIEQSRRCFGAASFNYELELYSDTSFSGKDLLRLVMRTGNFTLSSNSFGGPFPAPTHLSQLEVAFQEIGKPNEISIDRLFYQFPAGDFTVSLGGRIGQDDMLAIWPSVYPSQTVLDVTSVNGAPEAYNKNLGTGAGLWWQKDGWSVSANYVADRGGLGDPAMGGIATAGSGGTGTVQVGYGRDRFGLAAIYSLLQNQTPWIGYSTNFVTESQLHHAGSTAAYGLSGYWVPAQDGWIPSVSAGFGLNTTTYAADVERDGLAKNSRSWTVGLQWTNAFVQGNSAGMAVGQATYATSLYGDLGANDANYVWEWWYAFQVSDNLAVTPALFYLSRPQGANTPSGESFNQLGALVKTTFRF